MGHMFQSFFLLCLQGRREEKSYSLASSSRCTFKTINDESPEFRIICTSPYFLDQLQLENTEVLLKMPGLPEPGNVVWNNSTFLPSPLLITLPLPSPPGGSSTLQSAQDIALFTGKIVANIPNITSQDQDNKTKISETRGLLGISEHHLNTC